MTYILIGIILGVVGLDQLTKWLANANLTPYAPIEIIDGVFEIVLVGKNKGVAGSAFSGNFFVTKILPVLGILALTVYLFRFCEKKTLPRISIAMMIGGGIGNMIDRLFCDGVTDFISMPFLPWFQFSPFQKVDFPIFNVADSFVTVGTFMLMAYLIAEIVKEGKAEKAKKTADTEAEHTQNSGDGHE